MPRSRILRGLVREKPTGMEHTPESAGPELEPLAQYPPGVEITGAGRGLGKSAPGDIYTGEGLGGGGGYGEGDVDAAAEQVRTGLQTIAAQYPDAGTLLQQFEESMQKWMGGGMAPAGEITEEVPPEI